MRVGLGEPHHRDVLVVCEPRYRFAERDADLVEERRRRDRVALVRGQEAHHLATDLQVGHVGVEVDPIQALQIQPYLPVEHVVDRHRYSHDRQPGRRNRP